MTFDEYQKATGETAIYPGRGIFHGFAYLVSKLAGEAGEVAEKFGKAIRDDGFCYSTDLKDERKRDILRECGDVLWYLARLADDLGSSLEEVAIGNIDKLQSRAERGTLNGSGDNR